MSKKNKQQNQRRYYLHRVLKAKGFSVNAKARVILVSQEETKEKAVKELVETFHYLKQIDIFGGG